MPPRSTTREGLPGRNELQSAHEALNGRFHAQGGEHLTVNSLPGTRTGRRMARETGSFSYARKHHDMDGYNDGSRPISLAGG